jgi:hypothetical protein
MARSVRALWAMADGLLAVTAPGAHGRLGLHAAADASDAVGHRRQHRLVVVMRGRLQCLRVPGSCRGGKRPLPHEPADHALGRSRGGWGTKLHLATDGTGLPAAVKVSAGQANEAPYAEPLLDSGVSVVPTVWCVSGPSA